MTDKYEEALRKQMRKRLMKEMMQSHLEKQKLERQLNQNRRRFVKQLRRVKLLERRKEESDQVLLLLEGNAEVDQKIAAYQKFNKRWERWA